MAAGGLGTDLVAGTAGILNRRLDAGVLGVAGFGGVQCSAHDGGEFKVKSKLSGESIGMSRS